MGGHFAVTRTKVQMAVAHTLGTGPPILWSPLNLGIFIYETRRKSLQILLRIEQADVSDSLMHGGKLLSPSQGGSKNRGRDDKFGSSCKDLAHGKKRSKEGPQLSNEASCFVCLGGGVSLCSPGSNKVFSWLLDTSETPSNPSASAS